MDHQPHSTTESHRRPRQPAAAGRSGRVLVLGTHRRQGIVTVRSLGRRGLAVTAGSHQRANSGGLSRNAARRFRYPPPSDEPAFLRAVEREVRTRQYDMLLPVTAPTVPPIVEHRERFDPHTGLPFLPYDRLLAGLDKYRTVQAAEEAGIPVPETAAPAAADVAAVGETLGYPVVVKPRQGAGRFGVHVCDSEADLTAAFTAVKDTYGPPLVQEFIPNGGELGV